MDSPFSINTMVLQEIFFNKVNELIMENTANNLMEMQVICLKLFGFQQKPRSLRIKKFLNYFVIINVVTIFYCLIAELLFVVTNFHNILDTADAVGTFLTEVITISKFLTFMSQKQKFYELIDKVKELSARGKCYQDQLYLFIYNYVFSS